MKSCVNSKYGGAIDPLDSDREYTESTTPLPAETELSERRL